MTEQAIVPAALRLHERPHDIGPGDIDSGIPISVTGKAAVATDKAGLTLAVGFLATDVLALFARKLSTRSVRVFWVNANYTGGKDLGDLVFQAATQGTVPVGGLPALQNGLANFLNANHANFLVNEFNNVLSAFTDIASPPTAVNVVRSTGFATHSGSNRGFAFEDGGEGVIQFPGLATTSDRLKTIANRYCMQLCDAGG